MQRISRRFMRCALAVVLVGVPSVSSPAHAVEGFDVAAENAQAGTRSWAISGNQFDERTLAYADHTSVLPGESFGLYVSCQASSFKVQALRIGDYSGIGARRVWVSDVTLCQHQPSAVLSPATGMRHAAWKRSLDIATTEWPEGMYVLKVVAGKSATYVDLVVRSASTQGRVVFVSSTQTFEAYNRWGGANAYRGHKGFSTRSREVSYDRPQTWGQGSGKFLGYEAPLVQRMERLGLPLAYLADTDLSADPNLLDGALTVVSGGHSEYWTQQQRDAFMNARKAGTNLLFFGANTSYWRVRLTPSALGERRIMSIYKVRSQDPNKAHPTIHFFDLGQSDASLLGASYNCFPATGTFTISDASSWVFAGTGVKHGSTFAGIIGPEIDRLKVQSKNVVVLANSPAKCGKHTTHGSMTLMRDPSGAVTIDVGTMGWVSKVLRGEAPARSIAFVKAVTDNLLRASVYPGLQRG
jgi:hypothetical protein